MSEIILKSPGGAVILVRKCDVTAVVTNGCRGPQTEPKTAVFIKGVPTAFEPYTGDYYNVSRHTTQGGDQMLIYILEAEHVTVPGVLVTAHRTEEGREKKRKALEAEFGEDITLENFECELED